MNLACATAVVEYVGEARHREFVMCSGMSGSDPNSQSIPMKSLLTKLGLSGPEQVGKSSTAVTATVSESVGEDRPLGIAKFSATRNLEVSSSLTLLEQEEVRLLQQSAAGYRREAA